MFNWGVVRDIFGRNSAVFSKIYDSARGLLWNRTEEQLNAFLKNNSVENFILNYCNNSKPKIGIEGKPPVNHFELIENYKEHYKKDSLILSIFANETLCEVIDLVNRRYNKLLSNNRRL